MISSSLFELLPTGTVGARSEAAQAGEPQFGITALCGRLPGGDRRVFMKTSGITATLPAQDLGRAKEFYVEKVGLRAVESNFLQASDGRVGLTVGDGVSQLFVYPARTRSSGEFSQAVLQVTDVSAAVEDAAAV